MLVLPCLDAMQFSSFFSAYLRPFVENLNERQNGLHVLILTHQQYSNLMIFKKLIREVR